MRLLAALIPAAALLAVACSDSEPGAAAQETGSIRWEACGQIQCATLDVPLDYDDPGGETIELSLIRIPAREPDRRLGVLMANPGGPGASANEFMRVWRLLLSNDIRNRFDLVSFDPRGVGESSPIVCHDTLQQLVAVDPDPDTDAEWEAAKAASKTFADACAARYADILPHVGTKNVARDMDTIRAALGEEKLNYVGYSYGTSLGAVYADMFPGRIRAMVLDGGTDLSLGFEDVNRTQMIGFERAFQAYLDDCKARSCALAKDGDPREAVEEVVAKAEASPIPSEDADRPAGPGEVQLGIISAMYSKLTWNALTRALQDAREGDGSGLVKLTDAYLQREPGGDYANLIEANAAVNYVDGECPKDPEYYRSLGERFAAAAPTFGRSAATSGLTCAYWRAEPDPVQTPSGKGAPPLIVIATTNDPATPYEWGVALSKQLESATLVTHRGEGHTIYAQGNACIDAVVNEYLLNLSVPAEGTTCGNGPPPPASVASATPSAAPSEADATRAPASATPPPPAAPETGGGRGEGSTTVFVWMVLFSLVGIVLAGAAVVVWRRG